MRVTDLEALADRLIGPMKSSPEGANYLAIIPSIVGLLAMGRPVAVDENAAAAKKAPEDVRAALGRVTGFDWDEQGRVVGAGLSLVPTPHRFTVGDRTVFTWCALDAQFVPALLGRAARVESPCRATGQPVRIGVTPTDVLAVDPSCTVVSVVEPRDLASVRRVSCQNVHFFSSPAAAARWLDQHAGATLLPVDEAFRLGQVIAARLWALSAVQV